LALTLLLPIPPAILAIPIARAMRRHRDSQVRGACAAIVIASCVLMATTSMRLAPEAAPNPQLALRAGVAFYRSRVSRAAGHCDLRISVCRTSIDVMTGNAGEIISRIDLPIISLTVSAQ
jgi:hypothetical protein